VHLKKRNEVHLIASYFNIKITVIVGTIVIAPVAPVAVVLLCYATHSRVAKEEIPSCACVLGTPDSVTESLEQKSPKSC